MRAAFWSLVTFTMALIFLTLVWVGLSSGYFLTVRDMTFDPGAGTLTMTRIVTSDQDVLARWRMSVQLPPGERLPDGRTECTDYGDDIYEPRYADGTPKTAVTFSAGDLVPCLMVHGSQIAASWQVLWKGVLPLKPTFFFKPPRSDR